MFDFRYHAISLAAVLIALALGVLLGVAIGDSNLVSSAKNGVVHTLQEQLDEAGRQSAGLQQRLGEQETAARGLYPLAVHELLSGRSIGLVFLGGTSDQVDALVRTAVTAAGGNLDSVVAIREPFDLQGLGRGASGTRYAALAAEPGLVGRFGLVMGRELVSGVGQSAGGLLSRERSDLFSAFDGQLVREEGIVVMRAEPAGMSPAQTEAADELESGLLTGMGDAGARTAGVELSSTVPSQISWYKGRGISSVDNLDTISGQVALDYALAGYHGTYGSKSTADSLLPTLTSSGSQP